MRLYTSTVFFTISVCNNACKTVRSWICIFLRICIRSCKYMFLVSIPNAVCHSGVRVSSTRLIIGDTTTKKSLRLRELISKVDFPNRVHAFLSTDIPKRLRSSAAGYFAAAAGAIPPRNVRCSFIGDSSTSSDTSALISKSSFSTVVICLINNSLVGASDNAQAVSSILEASSRNCCFKWKYEYQSSRRMVRSVGGRVYMCECANPIDSLCVSFLLTVSGQFGGFACVTAATFSRFGITLVTFYPRIVTSTIQSWQLYFGRLWIPFGSALVWDYEFAFAIPLLGIEFGLQPNESTIYCSSSAIECFPCVARIRMPTTTILCT